MSLAVNTSINQMFSKRFLEFFYEISIFMLLLYHMKITLGNICSSHTMTIYLEVIGGSEMVVIWALQTWKGRRILVAQGLMPGGAGFFSSTSTQLPYWLRGVPSLLSSVYQRSFSSSTSEKVKNSWIRSSTYSHACTE
jgi:hypothetical protein